jgi:hypothetical protein
LGSSFKPSVRGSPCIFGHRCSALVNVAPRPSSSQPSTSAPSLYKPTSQLHRLVCKPTSAASVVCMPPPSIRLAQASFKPQFRPSACSRSALPWPRRVCGVLQYSAASVRLQASFKPRFASLNSRSSLSFPPSEFPCDFAAFPPARSSASPWTAFQVQFLAFLASSPASVPSGLLGSPSCCARPMPTLLRSAAANPVSPMALRCCGLGFSCPLAS